MGKNPSLIRQIDIALNSMMCAGASKHAAKAMAETPNSLQGIYSYQTLRTYIKQSCEFAKWAKSAYGGKRLADIKQYVPEYLQLRIDAGISPYTIRLDSSALAKLYGCSSTSWGVMLPKRERAGITRSRLSRAHDREFSEERNADVVDFCKGTGLRKHELVALAPDKIKEDGTIVFVDKGKGGKSRVVPVLPAYQTHVMAMRNRAIEANTPRVFSRMEIKNRMDQHAYRRSYAQALYKYYLSMEQFMSNTKYHCRKDKAGATYDRGIMLAVSIALGHNRIDVIAISYL